MGKRGPKGNSILRGHEAIRSDDGTDPEIQVHAGYETEEEIEEPLIELNDEARRIYFHTARKLLKRNMLSDLDTMALARYADYMADWIKYNAFLKKKGLSAHKVNKNGGTYEQKFPEASRIRELETAIIRLEKDLGLTPASRGQGSKGGGTRAGKGDARSKMFSR